MKNILKLFDDWRERNGIEDFPFLCICSDCSGKMMSWNLKHVFFLFESEKELIEKLKK